MDCESLRKREWLETNGLGGYASSSVAGANTRRYSGLLVAALHPPVDRYVLLSKLEESVVLREAGTETTHDLSCNFYPGVIAPQGFSRITEFRKDPFPTTTFNVAGLVLEKTVFMRHGEDTIVVEWKVANWGEHTTATLLVRPLVAFRDFHCLTHENSAINGQIEQTESGLITITPYQDLPTLYLAHNAQSVEATQYWYRNFEYPVERERGLDFREDLFNPCLLRFVLTPEQPAATVIASLAKHSVKDTSSLRGAELDRRKRFTAVAASDGEALLRLAADQFLVKRGDHKTVIAGYPWFSDWGRDTMISLPGLALATGEIDGARDVLLTFAGSMNQGMLPNRFPDHGEPPEYNTVDATLWFFQAVTEFWRTSGEADFVRDHLFPALAESIAWHIKCTRHGIRMDEDALLLSGEPGVQLTWMDAKVGDWVVTPRRGKPVEIQALWYNALLAMNAMSSAFFPDQKNDYAALAARLRSNFAAQFWNESQSCLYDVVSGNGKDASIRPNQLIALSLPYPLLDKERSLRVLATVERELLTPFGLRTLSPQDPQYRPEYRGGVLERDSAYHQGTVWPWLLGPFLSAYLRVHENSAEAAQQVRAWMQPLLNFLSDPGLGQIPEVFDGSAPQHPGGCLAQAWSVAELLRLLSLLSGLVAAQQSASL